MCIPYVALTILYILILIPRLISTAFENQIISVSKANEIFMYNLEDMCISREIDISKWNSLSFLQMHPFKGQYFALFSNSNLKIIDFSNTKTVLENLNFKIQPLKVAISISGDKAVFLQPRGKMVSVFQYSSKNVQERKDSGNFVANFPGLVNR